jgi:hypothetical protein
MTKIHGMTDLARIPLSGHKLELFSDNPCLHKVSLLYRHILAE